MKKIVLSLTAIAALSASLQADEMSELKTQLKALTKRMNDIESKNEASNNALIEEVSALKTFNAIPELASKSYTGLGYAASKVFYSKSPLSIGGYGKVDYINYTDRTTNDDTADNYRAIFYIGYKFTDNIIFNSEIEFEHGGAEGGSGEAIVEFASIDFLIRPEFNVRAGQILVPVGHINMKHEPTMFNAVNRPETEKYIIPSTWGENGILTYGTLGDFDYTAGIVASLNSAKGTGKKTWRSARQGGRESKAEDFAFVGRLEYHALDSLDLTTSIFTGDSGQNQAGLDGVSTTIWEAHAVYKEGPIELTALYANATVDGEKNLATFHADTAVSSEGTGYYVNAAYNINEKWTPFIRYENYNAEDETLTYNTATKTILKGSEKDTKITALGVNYRPHPNVILKADYLLYDNKGTDDDRLELSMGYIF